MGVPHKGHTRGPSSKRKNNSFPLTRVPHSRLVNFPCTRCESWYYGGFLSSIKIPANAASYANLINEQFPYSGMMMGNLCIMVNSNSDKTHPCNTTVFVMMTGD